MLIDLAPLRCGRCLHTIRSDEPYESRTWEINSGPPVPGVIHTQQCPTDADEALPLPCTPCLQHLVTGAAKDPHNCALTTHVSIRGGDLIIGAEQACPCICPVQPESDALQAARAQARGAGA
ncbi:hypothetical protein [Streptomyces venezuelae]|uniref:hypothetical protein n=1 Tax=Streptomyces venezuelae TaxID=54571 RepID=UPI0036575431